MTPNSQVVRNLVGHGVHVAGVVHHEVSDLGSNPILVYKLHDSLGHVLAAVLPAEFFIPITSD